MPTHSIFSRLAKWTSTTAGHPATFIMSVGIIVVWAMLGPFYNYSDTWQLVINTGTTIITFLMVFLIQNTQNRDSQAVQIKLDELIRATKGAHNSLLMLEELQERELALIRSKYQELAMKAREELRQGLTDTDDEAVDVS